MKSPVCYGCKRVKHRKIVDGAEGWYCLARCDLYRKPHQREISAETRARKRVKAGEAIGVYRDRETRKRA